MTTAAPVVIANRITLMTLAGPTPSGRDRKEIVMMGREKLDASRESVLAAATGIFMGNLRLLRIPVDSARSGMVPGRAALTQTIVVSWLEILDQTIAPFHRRVMSNRRRLQR
jgi:hypothetical protein